MNRASRLIMAVFLALTNLLASELSGAAGDPLPGTCGLPNPDTITFAFAGPMQTTDIPVFEIDMKSCQAGTMDMSYVYGCGAEYYSANPGHGALHLSLAQAGFRTPYEDSTTLADVMAQTQDTYLLQAITAYLNSLYVEGYAYDVQSVLDGYHHGAISEGSFNWNNHGAMGQFVVPSCPLGALQVSPG